MKTALLVILAAGEGFAAAGFIVSKRNATRYAAELAEQQAVWQAEKAALEDALEAARTRPVPAPFVAPANAAPAGPVRPGPAEIIARLQTLKGGGSTRNLRESVYWLAELVQIGPASLPAIREFLARSEDLDLEAAGNRRGDIRVPLDFVLAPSLRFGLFDVLRQIGGAQAEQILAESLIMTGRGVEVFYLARVLQEMAPNKYRDQALSVARQLLSATTPFQSVSPLDRSHRENLYSVLT